jgi:hypothetical protein
VCAGKFTDLKLFENRVLTKIFGPKRDKAKGEWKGLYNVEVIMCIPH